MTNQDTGTGTPAEEQHPTLREIPLAHPQERLWFLHQLHPDVPVYNEPAAYGITGELDVPALTEAIRALVGRHEPLRTGFAARGDRPVQLIADELPFELPVENLGTDAGAVLRRLSEAASKPFDLSRPGLFDIRLAKLSENHHILYLNLHHLITDGLSGRLLIDEIGRSYLNVKTGRPPVSEPLAVSYSRYSVQQRERLAGAAAEADLAHWESVLTGVPGLLRLPTDHPRGATQDFTGADVRFKLSGSSTQRLTEVAKQHNASHYMVLLAAFNLLLHRYSGQQSLVVGTPVANRPGDGLEQTLGFFVNTLPIRSDHTPGQTFADYLGALRETCLDAFAHQETPFDHIVQRLGLQGELSHAPLVQTVFAYNHSRHRPQLAGLEVRPLDVRTATARYELGLYLDRSPQGGLDGRLEFATALFDRTTVARLAENYRTLLDGLLADPDRPLEAYELCSPAERALIARWNRTGAEFPDERCVHELFEAQAARTPDAVAVSAADGELTYRELDRRASALAAHLRGSGVGPDQCVGVFVERSVALVVALLGILKAGGAYLPLDLAAPRARLEQILRDARARVVLTGGVPLEPFDGIEPIGPLPEPDPTDGPGHSGYPEQAARPEHLVSVYYTSGSTGAPKGVANRHRGWVNRLTWMQRRHALRPGETVLHKTTLTFDDSALEIFWPLSVGGRVAVLPPDLHRDPQAIVEALARHRSVYLQVVPSMLNSVLDVVEQRGAAGLEALRGTTSSGEALSPGTVRRFHALMPGELHNTWGATEVSIDSTHHTCTAEDAEDLAGAGPVSLGRPFDNNTVHVLDASLRPVPIGVVGDLYIGGVGLARGYASDPARTAAAFVPHPSLTGERLYRTGDKGLLRPDGRLEFVGRTDHQVKIRGMRVELGEIEAVLEAHPGVKEAVVLVHEGENGLRRLIAYLTPLRPDRRPSAEEVRAHVGQRLPEYMVPSFVTVQDRFEVNTNGKIDRGTLAPPERLLDDAEAPGEPCEGPVEAFVADIWRDLLGLTRIGALDGFFALGGNSLVATRFVSRVRQRAGIDLPLMSVFTKPTLRELSAEVQQLLVRRLEEMSEAEAGELLRQLS
ncbi:amino acid adenylation domain-containing protein [Kitasatospora sp. NPDC059648]|uniref:non-ribosomal peptide synthetase n=1 Tax=Kitasatospora sp. NPDC059648 TaxID=3346894 RepID=UPI0036A7B7AC